MRAAKCRPQQGVQRGLPLVLLGNFQRYGVLRLGKFPNKLWYFLRKYPAACRLPFGGGCPCRLLAHTSTLFFPFRWVGGGAVAPISLGREILPCPSIVIIFLSSFIGMLLLIRWLGRYSSPYPLTCATGFPCLGLSSGQ